MSIKAKLKAAVSKAYSIKGGPGDKGKGKKEKVQEVKEVNASGNVFEGPFSRMKAKQAIRKGTTDVSYAMKKGLGGKQKMIKYGDKGNNTAAFMKKTVTTPTERLSVKSNRLKDKE
jgi:hypothetical protein